MIKISPSMLSCDMSRFCEECRDISAAGADYIHLDVMDGAFVPNITFGAPVIKWIRPSTDAVFDVHLMINDPAKYIKDFADAGADIICVHEEACSNVGGAIDLICAENVKAALSIKPNTSVQKLFPYLDRLSMVLIMGVEPGFGGQSFIESTLPKIRAVRDEIKRRGLDIDVEVDGGVTTENVGRIAAAGANVIVAGSAIFNSPLRGATIAALRKTAEENYTD